eukprot:74724-Rhodomonas_salina.4
MTKGRWEGDTLAMAVINAACVDRCRSPLSPSLVLALALLLSLSLALALSISISIFLARSCHACVFDSVFISRPPSLPPSLFCHAPSTLHRSRLAFAHHLHEHASRFPLREQTLHTPSSMRVLSNSSGFSLTHMSSAATQGCEQKECERWLNAWRADQ